MSNSSNGGDARTVDFETLDRRYAIAVNLECWELLAMHSIANDESIPRIRLRMMKAFAGLPPGGGATAVSAPAPPTTASRRGGGNGSNRWL
ncbi:hypothetical protein FN846DRAFT_975777 [Sphaerosporella brunnea]|uniref:Uncharacterized protein n=1 Tax=Sphaerosporella brunnea TaxID=1250544 RepID=A0A5J5EGP5_9PEZI|nr:hypothetical protein FN846DRAFT_975777 [Sphaerosporella brunnea]